MENVKISGLEENEFGVYKNLLSLKRATVLELAQISNEKRSSLYRYLESLIGKGLVSEIYEGKRHFFIAESPQALINYTDQQKEKIKDILPELEAMEKDALERPKIKYFEGRQGVKHLYNELLETRQEILAFAWPEKLLDKISEEHENFVQKRLKLKIPARVIYPDTKAARRRYTGLREVRFSKNLPPFDSIYMISANKVVTISFKRWITGVIIENKEIADGLRAFFDALWVELK